jgi:hypothetical protein
VLIDATIVRAVLPATRANCLQKRGSRRYIEMPEEGLEPLTRGL